jgi:hypothetical protein
LGKANLPRFGNRFAGIVWEGEALYREQFRLIVIASEAKQSEFLDRPSIANRDCIASLAMTRTNVLQ